VSRLEVTGIRVFTIWTNTDVDLEPLQPDIGSWPRPSLAFLRGTAIGAKDFALYLPVELPRLTFKDGKPIPIPPEEWQARSIEEQFDALLYLGPRSSITHSRLSSAICSDTEYLVMRSARMLGPRPPGSGTPIDDVKRICNSASSRSR
jgi:hypothetical protein